LAFPIRLFNCPDRAAISRTRSMPGNGPNHAAAPHTPAIPSAREMPCPLTHPIGLETFIGMAAFGVTRHKGRPHVPATSHAREMPCHPNHFIGLKDLVEIDVFVALFSLFDMFFPFDFGCRFSYFM
jgi:hypothetical protein